MPAAWRACWASGALRALGGGRLPLRHEGVASAPARLHGERRRSLREQGRAEPDEDEEQERHLDEREGVVGDHPDREGADARGERREQPASVGVVALRLAPNLRTARTKNQSQPNDAERAVSSSVPSHWSSRMFAWSRRGVSSRRRRACRSPRRRAAAASTREARPEVGEAAAAARARADCCSATRPPAGMNDSLSAPSVPGSTKWMTTSDEDERRPQPARLARAAARGTRSATTTSIMIPVRDTVDAHADDQQRAPTRSSGAAGSAARGRWRAGASIDERGAERDRVLRRREDAQPRRTELLERRPSGPLLDRRNGITRSRWLKTLNPVRASTIASDRHHRSAGDERLREEVDAVEPPDRRSR